MTGRGNHRGGGGEVGGRHRLRREGGEGRHSPGSTAGGEAGKVGLAQRRQRQGGQGGGRAGPRPVGRALAHAVVVQGSAEAGGAAEGRGAAEAGERHRRLLAGQGRGARTHTGTLIVLLLPVRGEGHLVEFRMHLQCRAPRREDRQRPVVDGVLVS